MLCLSAYGKLYEIFDVSFREAGSVIFQKCLILTSSLLTALSLPAYDDLHQEMYNKQAQ